MVIHLVVKPSDGLITAEPIVRISGLRAGRTATLTVQATDAAEHRWVSTNTYIVNDRGTVDLGEDAPVEGTYRGVDQSGPWWSMQFDSDVPPVAFAAPADQLEYLCRASSEGAVSSTVVVRRWSRGVRRCEVRGDGFVGVHFEPVRPMARVPGVLVVPGATGVEAMTPLAALLASHGFAAMVVAYVRESGLPRSLREIPAEVVLAGLQRLAGHAHVDAGRLAVVATSFGTEGALAALAYGSLRVRGVVAISPSSVTWQAFAHGDPPPRASSWSFGGEPLAWARVRGERLYPQAFVQAFTRKRSQGRFVRTLPAFAGGLRESRAARAVIPVERISAPLLVISGQDDQVRPSAKMARQIMLRRESHGSRVADRSLEFPDAGHLFHPPITPTTVPVADGLLVGGTAPGTARAQRKAWLTMLEFLALSCAGQGG